MAAEEVAAANLALLDRLRAPGDDLRRALEEVALGMLAVCHGEQSRSLRRLTHAQVAVFPDLAEAVQARTSDGLAGALADRLARLILSGRLRTCDPAQAAEQFLALLTAPLEARSRLGTREVGPDQLRAVAGAAVDTFLRAYAAPGSP